VSGQVGTLVELPFSDVERPLHAFQGPRGQWPEGPSEKKLLMRFLVVTPRLRIPCEELRFTYARSGGPGGQNVNKVNSKATLRWNVGTSGSVPEDVRAAVTLRCRRRMTSEGDLLVTSQRFRDAGRNAADCLEKLRRILVEVATPRKARKPTRPTTASKHRRLDQKRRTRRKKESRRPECWPS